MFSKAKIRFLLVGLIALVAALAVPSLALAGGWAVVTLDRMPEGITAGQPVLLGMMVRQHGRSPLQAEEIQIEASHAETGQAVKFSALPDGQPGHYQAELLFPEPGLWKWKVASGLFPIFQPLPALEVAGGAQPGASTRSEPSSGGIRTPGRAAVLLGALALLAFAAGVLLLVRGWTRRFRVLPGVGLLALCGALVFALFSSADAESQQIPATSQGTGKASGQQLFLAKGCVVCHVNDRAIENSQEFSVGAGPDLTKYRSSPQFLRQFLADPGGTKTTTDMPNLELAPAEIDALVSFLIDAEE